MIFEIMRWLAVVVGVPMLILAIVALVTSMSDDVD